MRKHSDQPKTRVRAAVGSTVGLDRSGFEIIPRDSLEEKRIRDEIRRLRVVQDSCLRGLSEWESDFLYKYTPRLRYLMAKAQMAPMGMCKNARLVLARIVQRWDGLCFRLNRILYIGVIFLLRLWRRLRSFCNWHPYADKVERSNVQSSGTRDQPA